MINRIENESIPLRGRKQYERAELLVAYDEENYSIEPTGGKLAYLWYPCAKGEVYASWVEKGECYTDEQVAKVIDVMRCSYNVNEVGYDLWNMFTEQMYLYHDVLFVRKIVLREYKWYRHTERGIHCKAFLAMTKYFGNGQGIYCNECGSRLTAEGVARYGLQHRFSGEMFCGKHETRVQFL